MNQTVGVIGAGRMGLPIIGHLARKGFRTLGSDVDSSRKATVEARGATWMADAAGLARESDFILICVGFDRQVRALFEKELLEAKAGAICAILSTIHPRTVQELAKAGALTVIDSTVCRGGDAADRGTLLSFVGGSAE